MDAYIKEQLPSKWGDRPVVKISFWLGGNSHKDCHGDLDIFYNVIVMNGNPFNENDRECLLSAQIGDLEGIFHKIWSILVKEVNEYNT